MTLTITGSGTQMLTGTNTYTGQTTVSGGTLVAANPLLSSSFSVAGGTAYRAVGHWHDRFEQRPDY